MEEVMLDMKKGQMSKLARGEAVQVMPMMVGAGMPMKLKAGKLSKLMKATTSGRGMRLKLDEEEMTGSGIVRKTKRTRTAKCSGAGMMMATQSSLAAHILPASRPLIQIGDAAHGDLFIR